MEQEHLKTKLRPVELLYLWCEQNRRPFTIHDFLTLVLGWLAHKEVVEVKGEWFSLTTNGYVRQEFHWGCRWYEHVMLEAIRNESVSKLLSPYYNDLVKRELKILGFLEPGRKKLLKFIPLPALKLSEDAERAVRNFPNTNEGRERILKETLQGALEDERLLKNIDLAIREGIRTHHEDSSLSATYH